VRSVRRAAPDKPGAPAANRPVTDGCSSTSGTGSRPSGIAKSASFAAAHSRFFARSRPCGAARVTAARAKHAASRDTEDGRQRAMRAATPGSSAVMPPP